MSSDGRQCKQCGMIGSHLVSCKATGMATRQVEREKAKKREEKKK